MCPQKTITVHECPNTKLEGIAAEMEVLREQLSDTNVYGLKELKNEDFEEINAITYKMFDCRMAQSEKG